MPAPVRKGVDLSAGHCHGPLTPIEGSSTVIINGISVLRVGDHYTTHVCNDGQDVQEAKAVGASSTVQAEGKFIHRIGDAISCGDIAAAGSPNVFVG